MDRELLPGGGALALNRNGSPCMLKNSHYSTKGKVPRSHSRWRNGAESLETFLEEGMKVLMAENQ